MFFPFFLLRLEQFIIGRARIHFMVSVGNSLDDEAPLVAWLVLSSPLYFVGFVYPTWEHQATSRIKCNSGAPVVCVSVHSLRDNWVAPRRYYFPFLFWQEKLYEMGRAGRINLPTTNEDDGACFCNLFYIFGGPSRASRFSLSPSALPCVSFFIWGPPLPLAVHKSDFFRTVVEAIFLFFPPCGKSFWLVDQWKLFLGWQMSIIAEFRWWSRCSGWERERDWGRWRMY